MVSSSSPSLILNNNEDDGKSSPPSRWQRLYSCKSQSIKNDISFEEIHENESDPQNRDILHEVEIEDNEAKRILDYMDRILVDCNYYDDEMISSIIDSQKQQYDINRFYQEKQSRSILKTWKCYTKSQAERREFIIDRCRDMINHKLLSVSFEEWKSLFQKRREMTENKIQTLQRKMMDYCFCSWANVMWSQLQTVKVCHYVHLFLFHNRIPTNSHRLQLLQEAYMKKKVLRLWQKVIKDQNLIATKFYGRNMSTKFWKIWKQAHNISKEAKTEEAGSIVKEEVDRRSNHHLKVTELMHYLEDEEYLNLNKENMTNNIPEEIPKCRHETQPNVLTKKNGQTHPSSTIRKTQKQKVQEKGTNFHYKRLVLKEKYIQDKLEREARSNNAKYRRDEEERKAYIKQKQKEKMLQQKRKETLEVAQKAWRLAKLHHSLVTLKRYFHGWKSHVYTRQLLWKKATKFWEDRIKSNCFLFLITYTKEKRIRRERNQFRNAGKAMKDLIIRLLFNVQQLS